MRSNRLAMIATGGVINFIKPGIVIGWSMTMGNKLLALLGASRGLCRREMAKKA